MSMPAQRAGSAQSAERAGRDRDLIAVVEELVRELYPQRARYINVTLSSRLDRDLGIDSLGRTELILRIERAFHVRLPIEVMGEANTVGDVLQALERARPEMGPIAPAERIVPLLPAVAPATEAQTMPAVLDWHVAAHSDRLHATILQDESTVRATMTYGELAASARRLAAGLIERDVMPGDRVVLMLPTGTDFLAAFFGILYAGAVPVPIYPPMQLAQLEEYVRRQTGILRNAGARLLVTLPEGLRLAGLLRGQVETLVGIESVASLADAARGASLPILSDSNAVALIQYTSGSTGDPKGVVLSHANLLANIRAIGQVIEASSSDVMMSWLPLYHDMGLIGAWLGSLYYGAPCYLMSPLTFLARPQSWLWAIHRYRATISAAPNFAYELCLNKIDADAIAGLDLSSLRYLANGAEPVSAHTMRRFLERFGPHGLAAGAIAPVYGLAENAVALTMPPPGRGLLVERIDRDALTRHGIAEPARPGDINAIELVACGSPIPGHQIRIVDEHGRELDERREGRLEFRGPSATSGYFNNDVKTRELIHDGWLDSGDRAYVANGEVFITGRIKDIIIRAGQHIYPQEIEEAIGDIPGVHKGGVAVFGVTDAVSGTERVVVLAETDVTEVTARDALRGRVLAVATEIVGTPPDEVILVRPGTVPKTASGKVRRAAARHLYLTQGLERPRRALRWQIIRVWIAGLGARTARAVRTLGQVLYAGWWWTVIGVGAALGWLAVMILPRLSWRWATVRGLARVALFLLGVPVTARGIERLPRGGAMVVFNHASYADALITAAVLPGEPIFVAKKEFARQFFAGRALRRLGAAFVERFDLAGSLADTAAVAALASGERNIVVFPEGTFTRRAGLSQFYTGAFKVASEANLPVFPGVLRGTRTMLRADQWFPRWTPIDVEILDPVQPAGTDFSAVLRLRDRVRQAMLERCGEPDLGELLRPPAPTASRTI